MQGHSGPGWAAFWGETDTAMNCPVGVQQLQITAGGWTDLQAKESNQITSNELPQEPGHSHGFITPARPRARLLGRPSIWI